MIRVYNDGQLVFEGEPKQFIADNQGDADVTDMVQEAITQGASTREFFSGSWRVETVPAVSRV